MKMSRYVGYVRVSTSHQADTGSLQNQIYKIRQHVDTTNSFLLELYEEVESGAENERPVLLEAIRRCQRHRAILLVSNLDRLSRDHVFLVSFREKFQIDFKALDLDEGNKMMLPFMAMFAEMERSSISERTKQALRAKRNRGEWEPTSANLWKKERTNKDAGAKAQSRYKKEYRQILYRDIQDVMELFREDRNRFPDAREISEQLNERRFTTYHKKPWTARNVTRTLHRWRAEWSGTFPFDDLIRGHLPESTPNAST